MKTIRYIFTLILFVSITISAYCADNIIQEKAPANGFNVFPNPVTEQQFTVISQVEIVEVKLLNLLGQQVFEKKYLNEKKVNIELETNEKGLYIVQVKTVDERVKTKRILFK